MSEKDEDMILGGALRAGYEILKANLKTEKNESFFGFVELHGFADAAFWDSFRNDDELYENLNGVIKGIMIGLDNLRQKIETLDL